MAPSKNRFPFFSNKMMNFRPSFTRIALGFSSLLIAATSFGSFFSRRKNNRIEEGTLLQWKITNDSIIETSQGTPAIILKLKRKLSGLTDEPLPLLEVLRTLKLAKDDPRIQGLYCRIVDDGMSKNTLKFSQLQEIRGAIEEFKHAKKRQFGEDAVVLVFSESFEDQGFYYLATAFEKLLMQPTGSIGLRGLSATSPFFKRLLNKLGISVRAETREDYKSVASMFTESQFPEKQKENLGSLLQDLSDQMLETACNARNASSADILLKTPFNGKEALEKKLIDGLCYREDMNAYLSKLKLKSLPHYFEIRSKELKKEFKKKTPISVGVVYILDELKRQNRTRSVQQALREAALDPKIDALVVRVASPGGDVVASDAILGTIRRIQAFSKKPVVISFGSVSASGGYYLSATADAIVAMPGTITGSIGVAALRPVIMRPFFDNLYLDIDEIHLNDATKSQSILHDLDEAHLERFKHQVDNVYNDFLQLVAKGRGMTLEEARNVAGGRVFSGQKALENGLVDKLGDHHFAIELAAKMAHATQNQEPKKPKPKKAPEALAPEGDCELLLSAHDESHPINQHKKLDLHAPDLPSDKYIVTEVFPKEKSFFELLQSKSDASELTDVLWNGVITRLSGFFGLSKHPSIAAKSDFEINL
ncbi:hypothetical protein HMI54_001819 [Coelomomyces lativittatus]|nr:hypothetical protein HMI54_001819 [Coelomomyces lativittatus]